MQSPRQRFSSVRTLTRQIDAQDGRGRLSPPGQLLRVTAGLSWPKAMATGIREEKADTEWPLKQFAEIKAEGSSGGCSGSKNRERFTAERKSDTISQLKTLGPYILPRGVRPPRQSAS